MGSDDQKGSFQFGVELPSQEPPKLDSVRQWGVLVAMEAEGGGPTSSGFLVAKLCLSMPTAVSKQGGRAVMTMTLLPIYGITPSCCSGRGTSEPRAGGKSMAAR